MAQAGGDRGEWHWGWSVMIVVGVVVWGRREGYEDKGKWG